jgi:signal transduction histidine kinase/CheY-like chemotaxis protein/HPt (histidine-containing phosphotransfer) domain-containing protein
MLSIRAKTLLTIIAIVLAITVSTLGASLFISQQRFTETVKSDLSTMGRIAAGMISAEISSLRQEVEFAAELVSMEHRGVRDTLEYLLQKFPKFLTVSVMDQNGGVIYAGNVDGRPSVRSRDSSYGKRAFAGETVISSTMYSPGGNLLMSIWSPVDENRILIASLPGMYFSNLVSKFRIWKTGNVFILDNEGISIAAVWDFRVQERHNYAEWGQWDPKYREIGEAFNTMVQNKEGLVQYPLEGIDRYCAFSSINGTDNWTVGVAAPLDESPLSHIQQMLLIFAAFFLGMGSIAALVASNNIAIPYEKMEELSRSAEAASESKTKFLANMSHEMRTPLNAIIGLSELELGAEKLEGDSFANMEKIYSAGMTLLGIINDLLDISKIEAGKLTIVPVVYDVPSMINDTISLNVVRIGSKPIQFRLHIDGTVPARLKGDELRVKQIFNNLLSNAFKYTNSGFVDWSFICKKEENRYKITSIIRDTGIGIQKEEQEKLFREDYYQANPRANYYVEGTGLGLPITQNLVRHMGGDICVKSEFGRGSVFTVTFYQETAGDEVIGREAAENLSQFRYSAQRRSRNQKLLRTDMSYATVLVVDDVVTNLDVARGMLKPYGITIDCATSGYEAVQLIRQQKIKYDAIFMDHMMPGMDGIEAAAIIRNEIGSDYAKNIPIIALTANTLMGSDSMFLEKGFQAFLSKPIDILRLDNILNQWVRNKAKEKKRHLHTPDKEEKPAETLTGIDIPDLNTADALARFENDRESYRMVLCSFVTHVPSYLENIKAFNPDMPESLEACRIAAHSIKGSGRSIGAEKLGAEAEKLEKAAATGDFDYITANNGHFVEAAKNLIAGIDAFLKNTQIDTETEKPEKESPDPNTMDAILLACKNYDMDGLKKAIADLAVYRYQSQPGFAEWLREQAGRSNFAAIQKKILNIYPK